MKKKKRKQFNYKTFSQFSFTFLTNQASFISKFIIKLVSSTESVENTQDYAAELMLLLLLLPLLFLSDVWRIFELLVKTIQRQT